MFTVLTDLSPYLVYAAPPLVGAFIGYLTNRIAIRMLFRPLKKWTVGPIRIPMTPGVIPAKRHEFAENIGTMVGEHLLTGEELSRSLHQEPFQVHLYEVFHTRMTTIANLDLGSVNNLIPDTYRNYFDIGLNTGIYRLKGLIRQTIESGIDSDAGERMIARWIDDLLERDIRDFLTGDGFAGLTAHVESTVADMLEDADLEPALTSVLAIALTDVVNANKSLDELLPSSVRREIVQSVCNQAPVLLDKAAVLLKDPEIQEKLVSALKEGVEEMVDGMGPMSSMVRGFLDMNLVDQTIRNYLGKKEDAITEFLTDDAIHYRVRAGLGERINRLLETPLNDLLDDFGQHQIQELSRESAQGLGKILQGEQIRDRIGAAVGELLDQAFSENDTSIAAVITRVAGSGSVDSIRAAAADEIRALAGSPAFVKYLDDAVDGLCRYLVNRPIGKLSYLVPGAVIDDAARTLTRKTTETIAREMPLILTSLNLRKIITERIDSFDLLRLEQLLLSIMQEQFKYINLFGALLGFLIGCINLLFIIGSA